MEEKAPTVGQVPSGLAESNRQKGFKDSEMGPVEESDIQKIERVYR